MPTSRVVREQVQNVLDYLFDAALIIDATSISSTPYRVAWHARDPRAQFLVGREHATFEQYAHWLETGNYSAILFDGSLLQIAYEFSGNKVVGHRLAYVPCPFVVDQSLLEQGESVADVIDIYRGDEASLAFRSPVRFDYDPRAAMPGHPAAHMTINSVDCRIACVAPMHVHRFVDFVFRHFYGQLWKAHLPFFSDGEESHLGERVITEEDRRIPHLMWNLHIPHSVADPRRRSSA